MDNPTLFHVPLEGAEGGMPGGMPDMGAAGAPEAGGPSVEEVD